MPYKDPEKRKAASRAYWEKNKERHRALVRANNQKFYASITVEQRRQWWATMKARQRNNPNANAKIQAAHKKWRDSEKGKAYKERSDVKQGFRDATARWRKRNWEKVKASFRERRARDPIFNLIFCLRTQVCQYLAGKKNRKTMELIGCTREELREHIEAQFLPGMSWENHGKKKGQWSVDHLVPLTHYPDLATNFETQKVAFGFRNLAPKWSFDNTSKGNRFAEPQHKELLKLPAKALAICAA